MPLDKIISQKCIANDSKSFKKENSLWVRIKDKLAQNHKMDCVGEDLKDNLVSTPTAVGRDAFH